MKVWILQNKGDLNSLQMKKADFLSNFQLNIRDLRPVFSTLQVATILPRQDAVIINLGFIKAVLSVDTLYLIDQEHSQRLASFINELKSKKKNVNNDVPFLLHVLDLILNAKVRQMSEKVSSVIANVENILPRLKNNLSDANLAQLLAIKKRISKMETRLSEIHSAVRDILEDDEDFKDLLAVAETDEASSDELESILEDFMERIEDSIGHIFRLKEEVEDTEEFIDLQLSSRRTKIVKFDLIATMLTLPLTFLAVVVGLYGVNLRNGFENSESAFYLLATASIIFFVISIIFLIKFFKKNNLL